MPEESPKEAQRLEGSESVEIMREGVTALEAQVQHATQTVQSTMDQATNELTAMIQHVDTTVQELRPTVNKLMADAQRTVDSLLENAKAIADFVGQVQRNPWILVGTAVMLVYLRGVSHRASSAPDQESV